MGGSVYEYARTKHKKIEHITLAYSMIPFKCLCVFGDAKVSVYYLFQQTNLSNLSD